MNANPTLSDLDLSFVDPLPSPAKRAPLELEGNAWRDGNLVVLPRENGEMPDRCAVCNGATDYYRHITSVELSPWWAKLAVLSGGTTATLVAMGFVRRFEVEVGLCSKHRARASAGPLVKWLGLVVCFALFVGLVGARLPYLGAGFLVVALVGMAVGDRMQSVISIKAVDSQNLYLRAGKRFLESLPARSSTR